MNIVWLSPEIPFPPLGGRNGVYNRIVQLSKYNCIFLFSIAYSEEEMELSHEMEKYCREVRYYNRNKNRFFTILKSLIMPYSVASRTSSHIRADLRTVFANEKIDIVIVDFPNMSKNIVNIVPKEVYRSLNQHNIEYRRMRDLFYVRTIPFYQRIAYYLESYRLEFYEKCIYKSDIFDNITFFSKDDCSFFERRWEKCNANLKVFPLGANKVLEKRCNRDLNHNTFLFVGRLDEKATTNVEAASWFCRDVLPNIEKVASVKVIIAGSNPCKRITELRKTNVIIIPNYESLDYVYSLADFVILPLLSGGGVKGKLLEAAAYGKIIISTYHGIEGTDFLPNEHVLCGNGVQEFAQACEKALVDYGKMKDMALKAQKLFETSYDWQSICRKYNDYLMSQKQ